MKESYRMLNNELCQKNQQARTLLAKTEKTCCSLLNQLQEEKVENNKLVVEVERLKVKVVDLSKANQSLKGELQVKKLQVGRLEKLVQQCDRYVESFSLNFRGALTHNKDGSDFVIGGKVLQDITKSNESAASKENRQKFEGNLFFQISMKT